MKILKEITDWSGLDYTVPNHTYAVNDGGKMVAYRKSGTAEWLVMEKPRFFDRSRRKFKHLKNDPAEEFFSELFAKKSVQK